MNYGADALTSGLMANIVRGMPITADLSRSDLLLICPRPGSPTHLYVAAHARPHSIASIYDTGLTNQTVTFGDAPLIINAWRRGRHYMAQRDLIPSGAPVMQEVYPIRCRDGAMACLLSFETSLIQLERHRQRHRAFRRAIEWVKWMCRTGQLGDAAELSPFIEWDGVLFVDAQRRIVYLSGIANNLYRHLGYMDDLRGKRLSYLNTADDRMVLAAFSSRRPQEQEVREGSRIWVRKVVPVWAPPTLPGHVYGMLSRKAARGDEAGAIIMVHDATEEHRKRQELKVKTTMIREVHHRVKNNLQSIAAMLRMQARRTGEPEALSALNDAVARILSVAVIHEFLSHDEQQSINIKDMCQRIAAQAHQVHSAPGRRILFTVSGPAIYLPSQQATACALVVNELLQNAVEHGFEHQRQGEVAVTLADGGDRVELEVTDDGDPLPGDFQLGSSTSLGLQIVQTLVQDDLHGTVAFANADGRVRVRVAFAKAAVASAASPAANADTRD